MHRLLRRWCRQMLAPPHSCAPLREEKCYDPRSCPRPGSKATSRGEEKCCDGTARKSVRQMIAPLHSLRLLLWCGQQVLVRAAAEAAVLAPAVVAVSSVFSSPAAFLEWSRKSPSFSVENGNSLTCLPGSKGKNRNSLACLRNAGFHFAVTYCKQPTLAFSHRSPPGVTLPPQPPPPPVLTTHTPRTGAPCPWGRFDHLIGTQRIWLSILNSIFPFSTPNLPQASGERLFPSVPDLPFPLHGTSPVY